MDRPAGAPWLVGAALAARASAETPPRPALANVRYEEDWSRLSAEMCRWWSGEFVENTGPGGDAWFAWAAWELKF